MHRSPQIIEYKSKRSIPREIRSWHWTDTNMWRDYCRLENVEIKYKQTTYSLSLKNTTSYYTFEMTFFSVGVLAVRTEAHFHGNRTPAFPWVENGERGKPSHCISRHRVGIIIPFRNRESHLRTFLLNIHPFLHIHELDYRIFVIDQVWNIYASKPVLRGQIWAKE
jgi:hypothetical protein